MIANPGRGATVPGKVYLVGAGPGDPELLTRKALRMLQDATLVLHDDLVAPEILALVPGSTKIFNVGKRCGRKSMTQDEIHACMIDGARNGHVVLRLKGGDPMVYGRAGEEMLALRRAGINFEVIPGVTSAFAAAAAAQIPLTDRRFASHVVFLTGHRCSGVASVAGAYRACGYYSDGLKGLSGDSTVVVYMPGEGIAQIAEQLKIAGLELSTPCVVVSAASTTRQQIYRVALRDLFEAPRWPAPCVIIIGKVVGQSNIQAIQHARDARAGYPLDFHDVQKEDPMREELPRISEMQETMHAKNPSSAKNDVCDFKREQRSQNDAPVWRRVMWNFAEAWYG